MQPEKRLATTPNASLPDVSPRAAFGDIAYSGIGASPLLDPGKGPVAISSTEPTQNKVKETAEASGETAVRTTETNLQSKPNSDISPKDQEAVESGQEEASAGGYLISQEGEAERNHDSNVVMYPTKDGEKEGSKETQGSKESELVGEVDANTIPNYFFEKRDSVMQTSKNYPALVQADAFEEEAGQSVDSRAVIVEKPNAGLEREDDSEGRQSS